MRIANITHTRRLHERSESCPHGALAVQIYGVTDVGLQTRNRAPTVDDSVTGIRSGNLTPSICGLKGSEDLGGGLKASFAL